MPDSSAADGADRANEILLPPLRRNRKLNIPGLLGRFSDGVARIENQVEPLAVEWDRANALAANADGPLWIALGDSSTQGVGASQRENGWAYQVRSKLEHETGDPWRLINLSMSGGRFTDVTDHQLPLLDRLPEPALVTCAVGNNDLLWRRGISAIMRDAEETMATLPSGTLLSRLSGPGKRPRALNDIFEAAQTDGTVTLFDIWRWPSGRGALAEDRFHPSDVGYAHMRDLAWKAIATELNLT